MSVSPPKSANRSYLQEISVNTLQQRVTHTSKLKKKLDIEHTQLRQLPGVPKPRTALGSHIEGYSKGKSKTALKPRAPVPRGFAALPAELVFEVFCSGLVGATLLLTLFYVSVRMARQKCGYLSAEEILGKVQVVSKNWHKAAMDPYLWQRLDKKLPLSFESKYLKRKRIVERRSKGKLYTAINRVTGQPCLLLHFLAYSLLFLSQYWGWLAYAYLSLQILLSYASSYERTSVMSLFAPYYPCTVLAITELRHE